MTTAVLPLYHASLQRPVLLLAVLSLSIQVGALVMLAFSGHLGMSRWAFGAIEMGLIAGLWACAWQVWRWGRRTRQPQRFTRSALWTAVFVTLCVGGDAVNRNLGEQYYLFDRVLKHSYLVQSVGFFMPAYLLMTFLLWRQVLPALSSRQVLAYLSVGLLAGLGLAVHGFNPQMQAMAAAVIAAYTVVMAQLALVGVLLWRTQGWSQAGMVALGAVLAAVADALIGEFWIKRDFFPWIEHINWMVYYTSTALLVQLPWLER